MPVTEGTFDGDVLAGFQQNPAILRRYFALYVEFLTEYGEELARCCQQEFPQYRQEYKKLLKIPRFIDAASGLRMQAYFLIRFASYCGVADVERDELMTMYEERIVEAMQQNQQASVGKKPEIRFYTH